MLTNGPTAIMDLEIGKCKLQHGFVCTHPLRALPVPETERDLDHSKESKKEWSHAVYFSIARI